MCKFKDEDTGTFEWLPADWLLNYSINELKYTHLSCFFLISSAEYISQQDLDAHYQVFFNIISVLIYQTTIINTWIT